MVLEKEMSFTCQRPRDWPLRAGNLENDKVHSNEGRGSTTKEMEVDFTWWSMKAREQKCWTNFST